MLGLQYSKNVHERPRRHYGKKYNSRNHNMLTSTVDPNRTSKDARTALHFTAIRNDDVIANAPIDAGVNPNVITTDNRTPRDIALPTAAKAPKLRGVTAERPSFWKFASGTRFEPVSSVFSRTSFKNGWNLLKMPKALLH